MKNLILFFLFAIFLSPPDKLNAQIFQNWSQRYNGSELASGIYFYKLTIFDEYASTVKTVLTNKMVLIK